MSKRKQSQVRFTAETLVWFDIRGEYRGAHKLRKDDENICGRFLTWLCDQDFYPAIVRMTAPGQWMGAFWPEHAGVVKKWLTDNGAEQFTSHVAHSY